MELAAAQGCTLTADFKDNTIKEQCQTQETSIMWQDYIARRPMEVETYLGSPIKLAKTAGIQLPRIETLYAVFHHLNTVNQMRPKEMNGLPAVHGSPSAPAPGPRMSSNGPPRSVSNGVPMGNGMGRPPRPRNSSNLSGPPPGMRRPPGGPPNGFRGPQGGYGPQSRQPSRRGSMEETDLGEFSHLVLYDDIPEAGDGPFPGDNVDLDIREREFQLRQRELALKEQEMRMRRNGPPGPPGPRRRPPPRNPGAVYDDEDEEGDYFDPDAFITPTVDPDQVDMMSMTSRKHRMKAPSQSQIRNDPEMGGGPSMPARNSRWGRPSFGRNRSSQLMNSVPSLHTNILDDPLLGYSSNRYGNVDRGQMHHAAGSRANSLTAQHLDQLNGPGGMGGPYPRRASQSPGNPYSPSIRGGSGRPSPPNGIPNGTGGPGGPSSQGRPSPPNGVRQPVPRYPPGQGNSVAPQQVEQRVGVSSLQPPRVKNVRSLTGSASASAGSGDSTNLESEPSAHSSQSSLGPRAPIGVQ
jgi:hypothetical protein